MFANPDPARLRRLSLRPVRSVCLDTFHHDPDTPCPWCGPDSEPDGPVGIAIARHAELVAEDTELYGWDG
jgi:hypothetical protein